MRLRLPARTQLYVTGWLGAKPHSSTKTSRSVPAWAFFLRRQTWLEEQGFGGGQIGGGVAAEAALGATRGLASVEVVPQRPPGVQVQRPQGLRPPPLRRRGDRRQHPHAPAHHQPRRAALPPGRPPLVIPQAAKDVLQVVVGAREPGDVITVKQ